MSWSSRPRNSLLPSTWRAWSGGLGYDLGRKVRPECPITGIFSKSALAWSATYGEKDKWWD